MSMFRVVAAKMSVNNYEWFIVNMGLLIHTPIHFILQNLAH